MCLQSSFCNQRETKFIILIWNLTKSCLENRAILQKQVPLSCKYKKNGNSVDKRKSECYLNIRKVLALKINEC